jgi:hypothetical protein
MNPAARRQGDFPTGVVSFDRANGDREALTLGNTRPVQAALADRHDLMNFGEKC